MFKRFLLGVVIFLFAANVTASAAALINSDVEKVIEGIRRVSSQLNISVWGKEYYTYQGTRRCELHWGNSQNNLIRFRTGNNNEVQRALVSFPAAGFDYDSFNTSMQSGFMYCAILIMAGVSDNEIQNFSRKLFDDCMADPYAEYFHKTYTLWSSQNQRNIIVDVEIKNTSMDVYMYAN